MQIIEFIFQTLLGEFIVVIAGFILAKTILERIDKWHFGGWRVVVRNKGKELVNRPISVRKAKEIFDDSADMSVFLKGVASPYCWITCDIISQGQDIGLLNIDKKKRRITINIYKKPPKDIKANQA